MTAVLVHGLMETERIWDDVLPRLDPDSVALTLPGHGVQRPPRFAATKDAYAEWLVSEVGGLPGPLDLVGHGWGGLLVLRAVTGLGLRVRSWVVDNAGAFHPEAEPGELALLAPSPEQALRRLVQAPAGSPDSMVGHLRLLGVPITQASAMGSALNATMAGCAVDFHRSTFPNVRAGWKVQPEWDAPEQPPRLARGLVVMPGADPYGAQTLAREVAAELGADARALDGLGHFWMLEDPGRAADLLNGFWHALKD
jgi:pimeloyl-ACP methyl ester carboxylesterase